MTDVWKRWSRENPELAEHATGRITATIYDEDDARAVLEAIREPSQGMRRAGDIDIPAHCEECPNWQYPLGEDEAAKVWQAMLDAALSE